MLHIKDLKQTSILIDRGNATTVNDLDITSMTVTLKSNVWFVQAHISTVNPKLPLLNVVTVIKNHTASYGG